MHSEAFYKQGELNFYNKINSDKIFVEDYLDSEIEKQWIVYSDRANNYLLNEAEGKKNGKTLNLCKPV